MFKSHLKIIDRGANLGTDLWVPSIVHNVMLRHACHSSAWEPQKLGWRPCKTSSEAAWCLRHNILCFTRPWKSHQRPHSVGAKHPQQNLV